MPTEIQRAQAIADAITGRATPQAQVIQLANALAVNRLVDPATLTITQKARLILTSGMQWATGEIKQAENGPVGAAAVAGNSATITANFAEVV